MKQACKNRSAGGATVALSGVFGRFVARSEAMRRTWRRFHVPYTILFFIVLFIHILEKTEVLGD